MGLWLVMDIMNSIMVGIMDEVMAWMMVEIMDDIIMGVIDVIVVEIMVVVMNEVMIEIMDVMMEELMEKVMDVIMDVIMNVMVVIMNGMTGVIIIPSMINPCSSTVEQWMLTVLVQPQPWVLMQLSDVLRTLSDWSF